MEIPESRGASRQARSERPLRLAGTSFAPRLAAALLAAVLAGWAAPGALAGSAAPGAASALAPAAATLHELPAHVSVQAWVRPLGSSLTLLVRVPLESMRDVDLPLRDGGRYLDLGDPALEGLLRDAAALWIADYIRIREAGEPLPRAQVAAVRLSLPSDRSFASFDAALAHVEGADPVPTGTLLPPGQALLDVRLEAPVSSADARFSLEPELAHLGVETVSVVRFLPPGGGTRVFRWEGNPGRVELDPRWHQAFLRFVELGFLHILEGLDHLLFILCLVIPLRSFVALVPVVTAFTLAHSITLVAAALGMAPSVLWFPPLIETLIAASIVWMALENIVGARLSRRWLVAFGFGLVHGFGFSFLLTESLQFAGAHLLSSLVAFNVGVELGQLAVLAVAVPLLGWLFRRVVAERMGTVILSALVAHEAWHWMTARGGALLAYDLRLPELDVAFLVGAMRWAMLFLVSVGAAWALSGTFGRWFRPAPGPAEERGAA